MDYCAGGVGWSGLVVRRFSVRLLFQVFLWSQPQQGWACLIHVSQKNAADSKTIMQLLRVTSRDLIALRNPLPTHIFERCHRTTPGHATRNLGNPFADRNTLKFMYSQRKRKIIVSPFVLPIQLKITILSKFLDFVSLVPA